MEAYRVETMNRQIGRVRHQSCFDLADEVPLAAGARQATGDTVTARFEADQSEANARRARADISPSLLSLYGG
jgi:hypothetical protein